MLSVSPGEKSPVPSRRPDLSRTDALDNIWAARYRSAVGSAIYLSSDRREIAFATKELARHMASPRQCDWECTVVLGRFLQSHPDYVRVTALDASAHDGEMALDVFSDSDWAGCLETRRSTDCHIAYLGGAAVAATTQTQPGWPATSSPDE